MDNRREKIHPYVFIGIHYNDIIKNHNTSKKLKPSQSIKVTQVQILEIVAEECEVSVDDILSKSRRQPIVDARYLCFAALKLRYRLGLKDIGHIVDKRDHTTVIHGLRNFYNRFMYESIFRDKALRIFQKLEIDYRGEKLTESE
jgi:chromosomal replication initiation ATPase DnaA